MSFIKQRSLIFGYKYPLTINNLVKLKFITAVLINSKTLNLNHSVHKIHIYYKDLTNPTTRKHLYLLVCKHLVTTLLQHC